MTPKRIQMSRQHPWRAENPGAVIVARPSAPTGHDSAGPPDNSPDLLIMLAALGGLLLLTNYIEWITS